ncbi:MAG: alpha-xylosidase [Halioglobus sp.]
MTELDFNSPPAWNDIPSLSVLGVPELLADDMIVVPTTAGSLRITIHSFGVRLRVGEKEFDDYRMLVSEPVCELLGLENKQSCSIITGADYTLTLHHQPLSFELCKDSKPVQRSSSDGHFVRQFRLPPFARTEQGWFVSLDLDASEPVYGLGEKWGRLDKRGQLIRSFNHDALGVNAEISYKNTPFAWSPRGWGAFVHTPAPVTHSVGFAPWSHRCYGILVEDSSVDLFLLAGENGEEIIDGYTNLTGKAPLPPLWSLGVILSKAYYQDPAELLATAREVRRRNMPCDVITIDGRAWQDTDTRFTFDWDSTRYPDPAAVIAELKSMNFKICIWEYPLVSVDGPLFEAFSEKGWLLKSEATGDTYRYQWDDSCFGEVLTALPDSGIVDFTHPDAYEFWLESHKPLFDLGIDMIKADFGEQIEADMIAYNGERGSALHNVYALLYNRCVYQAAERYCQSGPFLFSRASWIGSQRYPAQWGGDPQADWGGLAASLRGGLSWGMSGAPFYATDVGGFYADQRDAELYVRWAQAAVFSAHMRLHGIGSREPWSYGEEAEAAVSEALALRYRLLPYLYDAMQTSVDTGLPVQRAMALAFPDERAAWAFEEQYMFGDRLLVAPCLRAGGKVEFFLPSGSWRRFPSGEIFDGSRCYTLELALTEMAVFLRAEDALPLGPALEHTQQLEGRVVIEEHWPTH